MQVVKVEQLEGLEHVLTVQLPWEQYQNKFNEQLVKVKSSAKIDGFRPGKVPESVIKQRYSKALEHDVLNDLIRASLPEALEQQKLTPAGIPEIDSAPITEGQPIQYDAKFEIIPEVTVTELANVTIKKPIAKVNAADIETAVESLRKQRMVWREVGRKSAVGDQMTVDFEGTVDGVPFQGNTATDFALVLGEGRMIPGFEEGLTGLTATQQHDLHVTFPAEYHATELAGKAAVFKINVKKVCEPVLPEVNDDFAKEWGIEEGGVETLKQEIESGLAREARQLVVNQLRKTVFDKLLDLNTFQVPKVLVTQEAERMQQQMQENLKQRYRMKEVPQMPLEHFMEEAQRSVALGLMLSTLIKKYELQADPQKVSEIVRSQASAYDNPEQIIKYMLSNKDFLRSIEAQALEEQVIDKLLETALVEEVESSYADLMAQGAHEHGEEHHHDENCDHDHDHHDH